MHSPLNLHNPSPRYLGTVRMEGAGRPSTDANTGSPNNPKNQPRAGNLVPSDLRQATRSLIVHNTAIDLLEKVQAACEHIGSKDAPKTPIYNLLTAKALLKRAIREETLPENLSLVILASGLVADDFEPVFKVRDIRPRSESPRRSRFIESPIHMLPGSRPAVRSGGGLEWDNFMENCAARCSESSFWTIIGHIADVGPKMKKTSDLFTAAGEELRILHESGHRPY